MRRVPACDFAKALRRNATEPERRLWQVLRAHRLGGLKFRRQVPIDGYVLDFVCLAARLIIEVDGSHHMEQGDAARDAHFAARGFETLRIWNNAVMSNPDGVAAEILRAARERLR